MIRLLLALLFLLARPADERTTWAGAVELPGGVKLEFAVELGKDSGTITIPTQGVKNKALDRVSASDKELTFAIAAANAVWELKVSEDGKTATGVLKQGGEFKTTLHRVAAGEVALKEPKRPQEPKPPFPYEALEVSFENKAAGATFAGTLTEPKGPGPFPCVVMVTGSGPQDRDETLLGHKPFLVIADHLTRNGVAVLRYDDRGTAKSTGKFADATSDDFAQDALAALEFLKTRKELDPRKLGIVGHSEGGLIAPICAAASKDVAFIVMLAGTGIPGAELIPLQSRLIAVATGTAAEEAEQQAKDSAEIFALLVAGKSDAEVKDGIRAVATRQLKQNPETKDLAGDALQKKLDGVVEQQAASLLSPWLKRFLVMDPRENLKKVTCPVLAVNGERDLQVPPKENLPQIRKALEQGGNKDVTIVEFPGLNHLFQNCKTGSPLEYAEIEETFAPAALEAVTSWIRKHTGLQ